ncbi:hypothetical protein D1007_10646 [Hordeum vulgare]|nr:hypothetical protein D1007_10646 [Hordeum vulgare]
MASGCTLICSYGKSLVGDTESICPLFDRRLGGYPDDETTQESIELPRQAVIYMAGTTTALDFATDGVANGSGASAPAPNRVGSSKTRAQAMTDLVAEMMKLTET